MGDRIAYLVRREKMNANAQLLQRLREAEASPTPSFRLGYRRNLRCRRFRLVIVAGGNVTV
jgi:hypothetical protein